MNIDRKGILYAVLAYGIWGVFPLYWKLLAHVDSLEVLVSRVIWSFVFTFLLIIVIQQRKRLIEDLKSLWQDKKLFLSLLAASFVISCNWFLYIYAVNNNHVVDASLGYYINPLITIVFGMIFFKEKLSRLQIGAVIVAFIGVLSLTVGYGEIPWLALLIALSFATYSALKKQATLNATRGLVIETMLMLPVAVVYYIYIMSTNDVSFLQVNWQTDFLLILGGIVTAFPLVLFAKGAKLLPQYVIGFIQYMTPTIVLILGVVLYDEPFTKTELISFMFIWGSIILFTFSTILETRKRNAIQQETVNVESL
ncbi:EamA family transporter RarD [Ureibacillus sinduriensis]|uniref:Transporter n=1 Tax=Ureibacillus sinduriensis BLB-1 = JCM 15800 TaxID=1384057 RepID=A0A0A3HR26_9BACL|nr:EamA family transporter RarD [Ureibacillus sinduriensis]KGR74824.1 transporter [Ureibacillus sinduriensis BLB-1 = JCM 15800]